MSDDMDRDDQGVVLQDTLVKLHKMIDAAEGNTIDEKLTTMLAFMVAAAGLGPDRSAAACRQALVDQERIQELLRRARNTPRH